MSGSMRAFVFEEPGADNVKKVDIKKLHEEDVLLKVERCGVCGTDIHIWAGTEYAARNVILGHEYADVIVEIRSKVEGYSVGERVALSIPILPVECVNFAEMAR